MTEIPVLRLEGLSRDFGALTVLAGVDLTVFRGEIVGILGPNGAGKSTLFNLIAGVTRPTGGSIFYFGRNIGQVAAWSRAHAGIGRTYQIPKPFSRTTVYENVLIASTHGRGLTVRDGRADVDRVLELTGLTLLARTVARDLSLLELKRLELAKALAVKPRLLLLDEIAGGLTDRECDVLLEIIRRVHAEGVTIIWIEHVIQVVSRAANRLAVLSAGKIMITGHPAEVLADEQVREVYLGA